MSKGLPEAKYTKFGEKIRHVIPGPVQCSVACGGRNCKWENPSRWPEQDQVIKGVFSSWVIEDVVAMSRPSTEVILKYNLIKQFKDNNIRSIINLQRPGEHASCGPPLNKESLFTYDPKVFMDSDVFFYNFGWKDYGVTSLETILDMVKVMSFALSEGKVAVHCHAGLGRTGVLVACYLVYAQRMDASGAIHTVRKGRPNSIQTRGQIACIQEFAQFLRPLRIVFPQVVPNAERLTLDQFLCRQRHLLHGFESRELRYLPKLVSVICQRLIAIGTASQESMWYDKPTCTSSKPKSAKKKKEALRSNTVETLMETIPGAFVNEKHEGDDSVDSTDSQKIDAILSPRFTRRKNSAMSQSSSEPKSHSRPESPTMSLDISVEVDIPVSQSRESSSTPRKTPTTPILVSCAPAQVVPVENDDEELEKLPSTPNVLLVKRGSRPILSASMSQSYPNVDTNSNNNNQAGLAAEIAGDSTEADLKSMNCSGNSDSLVITDQPSANTGHGSDLLGDTVSANEEMENRIKSDTNSSMLSTLPSPMPSAEEPQMSPSKNLSIDNAYEPAEENMTTLENSQTINNDDTGDEPEALKSLTLSLLAGDSMVSAHEDCQIELDENRVISNEDCDTSAIDNSFNDLDLEEMGDKLAEEVVEDVLDLEIEKICDEKRKENLSQNGRLEGEREAQETGIPCIVSWTEGNDVTDGAPGLTVPTKTESDGRRTPLMYRAGKTLELLDHTHKDNEYDIEASMIDNTESDSDDTDYDNELSKMSLQKPTVREGKRPKSAGFLKRLAEKNRNDSNNTEKSAITAQSLCDLTEIEGLSQKDIELMRFEVRGDILSPATPTSECSVEVYTPTGSATKRKIKDPITVAMALGYKLTNDEWMWEKVYSKQVELNTREDAWSSLDIEGDPYVLTCLMWSWIEHLSKPILTSGQVETLVERSKPDSVVGDCTTDPSLFEKALADIDKPISASLRCIIHCLSSLPPLPLDLELSAVKRCIVAFTHSSMDNGNIANKDPDEHESYEQLISLIQSYIVKTRQQNALMKAISESTELNDASKRNSSEFVSEEKNSEFRPSTQLRAEYPRGDGDSVAGASKVPELPARIAVS